MDDADGIEIRPFEAERDKEAGLRIYREVGWLEKGKEEAALCHFSGCQGFVAALRGEAESLALGTSGTLRYLRDDLAVCLVAGVTTSRIVRKRGLAARLTAQVLAQGAAEGAAVAALGMFEQGYYNQLGFGTLGYEHILTFDPADLSVSGRAPVPTRLSADDWERVHRSRLSGRRTHGGVTVLRPEMTRAEMLWTDQGFGLGYVDASGAVTHHLWASAKEQHGPYRVGWITCRTRDEFLDLLRLLRELGDQVRSVRLHEPLGVQFQDLLRRPFARQDTTRGSKHESAVRAYAEKQARILNLPLCLAHTHLDTREPLRFQLSLSDPVGAFLPPDAPWRGISGEYQVALGPTSSAEPGSDRRLPALKATVGAFTRLWLGVRPATSLSWTDDLEGPPDLLEALADVLRLPEPTPDWDF